MRNLIVEIICDSCQTKLAEEKAVSVIMLIEQSNEYREFEMCSACFAPMRELSRPVARGKLHIRRTRET